MGRNIAVSQALFRRKGRSRSAIGDFNFSPTWDEGFLRGAQHCGGGVGPANSQKPPAITLYASNASPLSSPMKQSAA